MNKSNSNQQNFSFEYEIQKGHQTCYGQSKFIGSNVLGKKLILRNKLKSLLDYVWDLVVLFGLNK